MRVMTPVVHLPVVHLLLAISPCHWIWGPPCIGPKISKLQPPRISSNTLTIRNLNVRVSKKSWHLFDVVLIDLSMCLSLLPHNTVDCQKSGMHHPTCMETLQRPWDFNYRSLNRWPFGFLVAINVYDQNKIGKQIRLVVFHQPIWQNMRKSKWIISPRKLGWSKKTSLSCHHLLAILHTWPFWMVTATVSDLQRLKIKRSRLESAWFLIPWNWVTTSLTFTEALGH